MHVSSLSAMYSVVFVGLVAAASDISLSNFTPRIDNLPAQCRTVYKTKIDGCASSDFALGATCSSGCLAGLARIGAAVKTGCVGVDVGETSIIGVFQNNLGVAALCPNNQPSSTSSSSLTMASTTLQSARTSAPATTTAVPPLSSARPSSASSSGLVLDTSATLATSTINVAPTSATKPGSAPTGNVANSQLSNSDSGGGSPFDVVATGAAPQLHFTRTALSALLATVLLVACV